MPLFSPASATTVYTLTARSVVVVHMYEVYVVYLVVRAWYHTVRRTDTFAVFLSYLCSASNSKPLYYVSTVCVFVVVVKYFFFSTLRSRRASFERVQRRGGESTIWERKSRIFFFRSMYRPLTAQYPFLGKIISRTIYLVCCQFLRLPSPSFLCVTVSPLSLSSRTRTWPCYGRWKKCTYFFLRLPTYYSLRSYEYRST